MRHTGSSPRSCPQAISDPLPPRAGFRLPLTTDRLRIPRGAQPPGMCYPSPRRFQIFGPTQKAAVEPGPSASRTTIVSNAHRSSLRDGSRAVLGARIRGGAPWHQYRAHAGRAGAAPFRLGRHRADAARAARRYRRPQRHRLGPRDHPHDPGRAGSRHRQLFGLPAGATRSWRRDPAILCGARRIAARGRGAARESAVHPRRRGRRDRPRPLGHRRRSRRHHRRARPRRRCVVRTRRNLLCHVRDVAAALAHSADARHPP